MNGEVLAVAGTCAEEVSRDFTSHQIFCGSLMPKRTQLNISEMSENKPENKRLAWPSDVEETVTLACLVASQQMKRLYLHEDAGPQKWFHILGHHRNFKTFLKKQVGDGWRVLAEIQPPQRQGGVWTFRGAQPDANKTCFMLDIA